jgi:hypothetical protein
VNKKIFRSCLYCHKDFATWNCKIIAGKGKYCSSKCYHADSVGFIPWNKGKKCLNLQIPKSDSFKQHMRVVMKGKQNCLGREVSVETRQRIGIANKGKVRSRPVWNQGKHQPQTAGVKNLNWKGDFVSYRALHKWVARWKGKPNKCELCGLVDENHRRFHWANKDHEYKRSLDDYMRLCVSCHKLYDKRQNPKEKS